MLHLLPFDVVPGEEEQVGVNQRYADGIHHQHHVRPRDAKLPPNQRKTKEEKEEVIYDGVDGTITDKETPDATACRGRGG